MFRFERLEVWDMAVNYGIKVYDLVDRLPRNEEFGLKSQLKRASLSISSNIAEGSGSSTNKDFSKYLDIAIKSTLETVSQLLFGQKRSYFTGESVKVLYDEAEVLVKRMQSLKIYLKSPRATSYNLKAKL